MSDLTLTYLVGFLLQWLAMLLLFGMIVYQEQRFSAWQRRCKGLHNSTTRYMIEHRKQHVNLIDIDREDAELATRRVPKTCADPKCEHKMVEGVRYCGGGSYCVCRVSIPSR